MEPVVGEFFASVCLRLGDLILMMGEEIVDATHVDIDLRTKIMHITSATLDMPAWTTFEFPKLLL
jgi:hypothetical protein